MSINQAQIFGPVRAGLAGSMDRDILIISTRVGSDPGGRDHQLKGGAGVTEPVAFRHNSSPASLRSLLSARTVFPDFGFNARTGKPSGPRMWTRPTQIWGRPTAYLGLLLSRHF